MKNLVLAVCSILVASLASAQDWAPDSLGNKIFSISINFGIDPFASSGTASIIYLDSGLSATFNETGDIATGQTSEYNWEKTSSVSGVLTGSTDLEEFNNSTEATFTSPLGGTFVVRLVSDNSIVQMGDFVLAPANQSNPLVNLSTRAPVAPGGVLISGFVVGGGLPQTVIIRAIGSELVGLGVPNAMSNTQLTVFNFGGDEIDQNDDWDSEGGELLQSAFAAVGAFELNAASGSAATIVTLDPGLYTVHVREESVSSGEGGEVLLEVYLVD